MIIINRKQIEALLPDLDLLPLIEQGFAEYSRGNAVIPPVGELLLDKGEVHIKYGYIKNDPHYVVKIASGFYNNPESGLPSSNGLMLVFNQTTGIIDAILLDEGQLTDIRTAIAGAIACKYLAPTDIQCIGIVGTGTQARLQLQYLAHVCACRNILVWGRDKEKLNLYKAAFKTSEFQITSTLNIEELTETCKLIITTTPAKQALLHAEHIRPGTHITAVGSDTADKQELDAAIFQKARYIIADSKAQCLHRGEIHHAIKNGFLSASNVIELGDIISGHKTMQRSKTDITIADLTGVAVQDIKIAQAVLSHQSLLSIQ